MPDNVTFPVHPDFYFYSTTIFEFGLRAWVIYDITPSNATGEVNAVRITAGPAFLAVTLPVATVAGAGRILRRAIATSTGSPVKCIFCLWSRCTVVAG